jgi:hypothetical protein
MALSMTRSFRADAVIATFLDLPGYSLTMFRPNLRSEPDFPHSSTYGCGAGVHWHDAEYRMQLVLNAPMAAHNIVASPWGQGVAQQVIAGSVLGWFRSCRVAVS